MRYLFLTIALIVPIARGALAPPDRVAARPPGSPAAALSPGRPADPDAGTSGIGGALDGLAENEEGDPDDDLARDASRRRPDRPSREPLAPTARITGDFPASIPLTRLRC